MSKPEKSAHKAFKAYVPCCLYGDVKYLLQMAGEDRRHFLFVAIDRAARSRVLKETRESTVHAQRPCTTTIFPNPHGLAKPLIQAMKERLRSGPELYQRRPYDRPGCDSYPTLTPGGLSLLEVLSPVVELSNTGG